MSKKACCDCWKEEFKKENFLLEWDRPECFGMPQSGRFPILYIIYRAAAALFFNGFVIYLGVDTTNGAKWFIYLTNWSILMLAISCNLQLACACYHYSFTKKTVPISTKILYSENPLLYKVTWVFFNIVLGSAPAVTIVYWGALSEPGNPDLGFNNFTVHAFNSIFVVIDMFITGFPVRWLHFYHVMIYGAIYLVFSAIYWAAGGTDPYGNPWIYPVFDWGGNPELAVGLTFGLMLIGVPVITAFAYGLYTLRLFIYEKCGCTLTSLQDTSEELSKQSMAQLGSDKDLDKSDTVVHI